VAGGRVRLLVPDALAWRDWDDGCVVFNRATGETHYLDLFTAYLLRLIEGGGQTADGLIATTAAELGLAEGVELEARVAAALRHFVLLALVDDR
jgi:PqqD family protein of HPr-rel-A system